MTNVENGLAANTESEVPAPDKKKKKKKTRVQVEGPPNLEGRVASIDLSCDDTGKLQIRFSLKTKKSKSYDLEIANGYMMQDSSFAAVLSAAITTKCKVSVIYNTSAEGKLLVNRIAIHSKD